MHSLVNDLRRNKGNWGWGGWQRCKLWRLLKCLTLTGMVHLNIKTYRHELSCHFKLETQLHLDRDITLFVEVVTS